MTVQSRLIVVSLGCALLLAAPAEAQNTGAIPAKLTLAEALRIAEETNPGLRALRSFEDIARADAREAGSRPNPSIAVEGEEYAAFSGNRPSFWNGQALIVRLEQEIETAGRRGFRIRSADAGIDVARAEIANARRQLQLDVSQTYLQLVLAQADRTVAAAALEEIQQVIALTQARFEAGEVAGTELRRLEVERLHFVDQVYMADLAISNARLALLGLLGSTDLQQPVEAIDPLPAPPLVDSEGRVIAMAEGVAMPAESLRAEAIAYRPDVRATRRNRERAETEIERQRALRMPNVTAAWGYRRDFGAHAMDFEISVPVPLFGGLNPGGVQRAEAQRRRAAALEDAAVIAVDVELQQAINAVEISAERARYVEDEYVRNAREARDLIQASYELGETALIDFLDAQREFRQTQQVRNQALYQLRISLIELAAAMGISPAGGP